MEEIILELLENKNYRKIREILETEIPADIATEFEKMNGDIRMRLFRLLPKSQASDVFSFLSLDTQKELILSLAAKEAGEVIDNLFADDATDLLEEMPAGVVKKILSHASEQTRREINSLLKYPESSAGSVMTVEYVDLKRDLTVSDAISKIRRVGVDKETIDVCYVLSSARHLLGTVSLRQLVLAHDDDIIGDIMEENVISVNTLDDREFVAREFTKYDFTTMPVVDSENRLVGIITVDDIVDIIEKEATEDIEMMAAITPTDKPYMKTGVVELFLKRFPWLAILMISATFTGMIMSSFEKKLQAMVVLASYIPMLMGTGGNSGSQSSVSVIRAISLSEVNFRDIFKVVFKEMRVSILCGVALAVLNFGKMMIIDRVLFNNPAVTVTVAVVVSLTMVVTVLCAKLIGAVLPLLAKKVGFDPAVMASPFITTLTDAISLIVYFTIAASLLNL